MGNILRVAVLAASVLAAIGSASAPKQHDVQRASTLHAGYDDTWSAVIDVFADHNWAIDKLDESSGIITTDWMSLGSHGSEYADCGSAPLASTETPQVRFNVRVKEDDGGTSITVNTSFRVTRTFDNSSRVIECTSKGEVEATIRSETEQAARANGRRKRPEPAIAVDAGVDGGE